MAIIATGIRVSIYYRSLGIAHRAKRTTFPRVNFEVHGERFQVTRACLVGVIAEFF